VRIDISPDDDLQVDQGLIWVKGGMCSAKKNVCFAPDIVFMSTRPI